MLRQAQHEEHFFKQYKNLIKQYKNLVKKYMHLMVSLSNHEALAEMGTVYILPVVPISPTVLVPRLVPHPSRVSIQMLTGPSLVSRTAMRAANAPVATGN
jgi:hypothetical protein